MGNIVLLDDLTINKIAAGEVIERPASVIKEMVENSIDAGATSVNVEIRNGGISYIRITDNGKGVAADDMEIAFERHATSKIRSANDLDTVRSMGFRGEALASIAAVANVEMVSKTADAEIGNRIVVEGGKTLVLEEAGCSRGTTITVNNLFYNTPVRYKFLKKDYTESGYIEDAITRLALVNPNISFRLINSGKTVIQTSGDGNVQNVIYSIYGKDVAQAILSIDFDYDDIHVSGVVGKPEIARSNRSNQLFFVNKRFVKDKILSSSVEKAFKGMLPIGKYAFIILNLDVLPNKVDVNVHPAKLEVRFEDENKIFKAVYHAIKETLMKAELVEDTEKDENDDIVMSPVVTGGLFKNTIDRNINNQVKNVMDNIDAIDKKNSEKFEQQRKFIEQLKKQMELNNNKHVVLSKVNNVCEVKKEEPVSSVQVIEEVHSNIGDDLGETVSVKIQSKQLEKDKDEIKEKLDSVNQENVENNENEKNISDELDNTEKVDSEINQNDDKVQDEKVQSAENDNNEKIQQEEIEEVTDKLNSEEKIAYDCNFEDEKDEKEFDEFCSKLEKNLFDKSAKILDENDVQYNVNNINKSEESDSTYEGSFESTYDKVFGINTEDEKNKDENENTDQEENDQNISLNINDIKNCKNLNANVENDDLSLSNISAEEEQNELEEIEKVDIEKNKPSFESMYEKIFKKSEVGKSEEIVVTMKDLRQLEEEMKNLSDEDDKSNRSENINNIDSIDSLNENKEEKNEQNNENINNEVNSNNEFISKIEDNNDDLMNEEVEKENVSIFNDQVECEPVKYKFIGIAFDTYIILEIDDELYILDQHAAHERILYEKVKKNFYSSEQKDCQMLLLPDIITLTHKEMEIAKDNLDIFKKAGFELEEFGDNTIKLTGAPTMCIDLNTKELFLETLDEITALTRTAKQEKEERFIATVACKAAVKAHMALDKKEVDSLMNELLKLPNPFTCPHGRPTVIKMTKSEIEKKFARRK